MGTAIAHVRSFDDQMLFIVSIKNDLPGPPRPLTNIRSGLFKLTLTFIIFMLL